MADLRISGLASGMNIDEIVTNLMKAERMPLDKIIKRKSTPNGNVMIIGQ